MHAENRTMTAAGYELNTTTTGACEAMALTRVLHTFLTADDHHEKLLRTAAATAGAAVGTSALWLLARAMRRALTRRFGVPVRRVFEMARVPDAGRGAHRHRNRQHPARLATRTRRLARQRPRIDPARAGNADGLLVFDPSGVTGHPDHAAATDAALLAAAGLDLPVRGWTLPATVAAVLNREQGTGFVGHQATEIEIRLPVDRARQAAACAAHVSQAIPISVLAAPGTPGRQRAPALVVIPSGDTRVFRGC